ncbi:HTH domain-containing protein [Mycobacteroides abscessus]|uniref:HTH domain-containing protein n=1 Tax=Mycobacteroides abscessus TaxID=36809 RepID=UPI000C269A8A|nr:HTH domain-containing protein [Mycobacteroides abscessus]
MTIESEGGLGDKDPLLLLLKCEKQLRAAGRPIPDRGPITAKHGSDDHLLELDRRMRVACREQLILIRELAEKAVSAGIDPGVNLDKLEAQARELLDSPVMLPPQMAAQLRLTTLGDQVVEILRAAKSPVPTTKLAEALNRDHTAATLRRELYKLENLGRIRSHRHAGLRNIYWSPATPKASSELPTLKALWDMS